jgi:regulatory protein
VAAQTAAQIAYRYVGERERTVAEVQARLARQGVDSAQARETIEELVALGLLDDRRYARMFVQDKRSLEHWGGERIMRELARRGIDPELIGEALAVGPGEGELERAIELTERRFAGSLSERRERDRALGVLIRKGYDAELALEAVRVVAKHRTPVR